MSDETMQTLIRRINMIGDETGKLYVIDGEYVGLGDLVSKLVRAIVDEQIKASKPKQHFT